MKTESNIAAVRRARTCNEMLTVDTSGVGVYNRLRHGGWRKPVPRVGGIRSKASSAIPKGDPMKVVMILTATALAAASFLVLADPGAKGGPGHMAERLKAADTNGD